MAKKFSLQEKPCQLGGKVITTGDGEGQSREEMIKFSLKGLMLNAKELDRVLGNGAHGRLFVQHKGEDMKPAFGDDVNELALAHLYADCTVTLSLDDQVITMPKAKISKVVLQPQIGGMTWMGCDVEAPTNLADNCEEIARYGDLKIAALLAFGSKPVLDKRQKELPMPDANVDADEPAEKPKRGNGGRVAAH